MCIREIDSPSGEAIKIGFQLTDILPLPIGGYGMLAMLESQTIKLMLDL